MQRQSILCCSAAAAAANSKTAEIVKMSSEILQCVCTPNRGRGDNRKRLTTGIKCPGICGNASLLLLLLLLPLLLLLLLLLPLLLEIWEYCSSGVCAASLEVAFAAVLFLLFSASCCLVEEMPLLLKALVFVCLTISSRHISSKHGCCNSSVFSVGPEAFKVYVHPTPGGFNIPKRKGFAAAAGSTLPAAARNEISKINKIK